MKRHLARISIVPGARRGRLSASDVMSGEKPSPARLKRPGARCRRAAGTHSKWRVDERGQLHRVRAFMRRTYAVLLRTHWKEADARGSPPRCCPGSRAESRTGSVRAVFTRCIGARRWRGWASSPPESRRLNPEHDGQEIDAARAFERGTGCRPL